MLNGKFLNGKEVVQLSRQHEIQLNSMHFSSSLHGENEGNCITTIYCLIS